jgi:hypothetical protein
MPVGWIVATVPPSPPQQVAILLSDKRYAKQDQQRGTKDKGE